MVRRAAAEASAPAGEANIDEGKTLFRNYCATCHNKNMKDNLTGPALGGLEERWADYPREDLYSWIRNSQAMVNAGHPRAVELWNEWKPTVMNNFNLTDQEIENIIAYVDYVYTGKDKVGQAVAQGPAVVVEKPNNTPLFIALAVILVASWQWSSPASSPTSTIWFRCAKAMRRPIGKPWSRS